MEHLRNVLLRLEETTSILTLRKEKNRRMYQESLNEVGRERS